MGKEVEWPRDRACEVVTGRIETRGRCPGDNGTWVRYGRSPGLATYSTDEAAGELHLQEAREAAARSRASCES